MVIEVEPLIPNLVYLFRVTSQDQSDLGPKAAAWQVGSGAFANVEAEI